MRPNLLIPTTFILRKNKKKRKDCTYSLILSGRSRFFHFCGIYMWKILSCTYCTPWSIRTLFQYQFMCKNFPSFCHIWSWYFHFRGKVSVYKKDYADDQSRMFKLIKNLTQAKNYRALQGFASFLLGMANVLTKWVHAHPSMRRLKMSFEFGRSINCQAKHINGPQPTEKKWKRQKVESDADGIVETKAYFRAPCSFLRNRSNSSRNVGLVVLFLRSWGYYWAMSTGHCQQQLS